MSNPSTTGMQLGQVSGFVGALTGAMAIEFAGHSSQSGLATLSADEAKWVIEHPHQALRAAVAGIKAEHAKVSDGK